MSLKATLRRESLQLRQSIQGKFDKDRIIFGQLIRHLREHRANQVLTYVSTEYEVDTRTLIDCCLGNKITIAIPGIVNERMRFFELHSKWNLGKEVRNISSSAVCIVPGLAFDIDGYRIGYGGGYYDRFLRDFKGFKIGLCYEELILDVPIESHDEKVDIVITD